jgi:hypothetical protein
MADFIKEQGDASFLRFRKLGRYFGPFLTGGTITTQSVASANSLRAFPFFVPKTISFDRIAIRVTTAGTGTTPRARIGVYADNGNIYPGQLVLDAGEVDVSSTGLKELTINLKLKAGKLYWLAFVGQDTASLALAAIPTTDSFATFLGFDNALSGSAFLGIAHVQTYGALPGIYPSSSPIDWSLHVPLIALRKA